MLPQGLAGHFVEGRLGEELPRLLFVEGFQEPFGPSLTSLIRQRFESFDGGFR